MFKRGYGNDSRQTGPLSSRIRHINLDCLRALEDRAGRYFVLLIVEQGRPLCEQAAAFDRDFAGARESWPHLDDQEARALWGHYLGYTTWQHSPLLSDPQFRLSQGQSILERIALGSRRQR
jgi:hypothetical protein